jgi:hypothetical protein
MSAPGNGNGNSVGSITDDLIEKAKAIANRSDELLHLLEDARQKLLDSGRETGEQRRRPAEQRSRPEEKRSSQDGQRGRREQQRRQQDPQRRQREPQRRFRPKPGPDRPVAKTADGEQIPEGLRLLTTQMSVEGSSREEILARLKNDFDVTNPEQVLKGMGL